MLSGKKAFGCLNTAIAVHERKHIIYRHTLIYVHTFNTSSDRVRSRLGTLDETYLSPETLRQVDIPDEVVQYSDLIPKGRVIPNHLEQVAYSERHDLTSV